MAARICQPYRGIPLGYYRSKWGSCNSKRVLSYHWAIVQAPEAVIDYLVAANQPSETYESQHTILGVSRQALPRLSNAPQVVA